MQPTVISLGVDNVIMLFSTPTTILLLASRSHSLRKWGGITGMFGQVFWITANCQWDRWGMFLVSVFCDLVYMYTVFQYWVLPRLQRKCLGTTTYIALPGYKTISSLPYEAPIAVTGIALLQLRWSQRHRNWYSPLSKGLVVGSLGRYAGHPLHKVSFLTWFLSKVSTPQESLC